MVILVYARIWPKGDKESYTLLRVLITILESPSRINEEHPISRAKEIARATTKASTTSRVVHRKSKTNPPDQTAWADQKPVDSLPVTVSNGSSPPKTNLGGLDGGFSSPKPNEPNPTDETRERKARST